MSITMCPEDLLVLARRRALSGGEQRRLEEHAVGCELCRMAIAIGARLDPLPAIDDDGTNDEVLAARLVARTLTPRPACAGPAFAPAGPAAQTAGVRRAKTASGRREKTAVGSSGRETRRARSLARGAPRWAVAAVVVLMAGSASAALWQLSSWRLPWSFGRRPATTAPARQERSRAPRRAHPDDPPNAVPSPEISPETLSATPPLIEPSPPAPSVAPPPSREVRVALARANPPAPATATADAPAAVPLPPIADASAATLFRAANQARRAGDLSEARRLYHALQARFPGSAEATLSFLSLGDLCLSRGAYADALEQFDAYLRSGDAALAEEALVGRARTLARLGRTADERETWQRLLASHPRSDYRWRAQQRLDALSTVAP